MKMNSSTMVERKTKARRTRPRRPPMKQICLQWTSALCRNSLQSIFLHPPSLKNSRRSRRRLRLNSNGTKIMANLLSKSKLTILDRRRRSKKNRKRSSSLANKRKKKRRIQLTGQEAAEVAAVAAETTAMTREELPLPVVELALWITQVPSQSSKAMMTITTQHRHAPPRLRRLRHKSKQPWN